MTGRAENLPVGERKAPREGGTTGPHPKNENRGHFRTSLQNAPSGYTEAQIKAKANQLGRDAWQGQGLLVIGVDDSRLSWPDRELLRQLARKLGYGEAP